MDKTQLCLLKNCTRSWKATYSKLSNKRRNKTYHFIDHMQTWCQLST